MNKPMDMRALITISASHFLQLWDHVGYTQTHTWLVVVPVCIGEWQLRTVWKEPGVLKGLVHVLQGRPVELALRRTRVLQKTVEEGLFKPNTEEPVRLLYNMTERSQQLKLTADVLDPMCY